MAWREHGIGRDDAEFLLPLEGDLALAVPAVREFALVLVDPLLRHVVRGVGGTRREVHEERLVRQQRLLLAHPVDRLIGQILGQVIALGRGLRRLNRRGALIQRRVPLVVLAADESVEVLEPATAGRPRGERPRRAGLPDRHLVALAELSGRVTIELQRQRQRRLGVRQHRGVARCRGGGLGDVAHADRMMVAAGEQSLPRRRAQRRGVQPRVLQPPGGELLEVRRLTRSTEGAAGAKAHVVDQDDEHVRRGLWRPNILDRRIAGVRILRVVGGQPHMRDIGNRKDCSRALAINHDSRLSFGTGGPVTIGAGRAERRESTNRPSCRHLAGPAIVAKC